jgi:hypothetical protein
VCHHELSLIIPIYEMVKGFGCLGAEMEFEGFFSIFVFIKAEYVIGSCRITV